MRLKMNLNQKGLAMFFNPYQIKILNILWESDSGLSSRLIWEAVGKDTISWSSVINYLNELIELDLLTVEYKTGKGGYHGIYTSRVDETGTGEYLKKMVEQKLDELAH